MGDYYQQAILTICATSGSSDQGLFPVLTGHVPDIARLRYRDKKGIPQGFFYVYPYGDPRSNRQTEEEAIRASELFTRGWVFQEWILSRRRVYFTPAGMIYDCETTGLSNNHREVWGSKKNYGGRIFERYFSGHRIAIDWWYWLLELYTEKSLTQPEKDRIVALKGIAEEFRELLKRIPSDSSVLRTIVPTVACGLEYLSGLWAYDLHRGLLWQRVSFAGRHQRLPLYPSWSWTAVVGPVEWPSNPAEKRVGGFRARLSSTSSESTLALHPQAKLLVARVGNGASLIPNDDLGTADRFQTVPIDAFGTLNKSATLQLAGKLVRVLIREEFSGERDHEILSNICGEIADTQSARTFWRKVCTTSVHTEVIGWASIDDPSFQEDSMYGSGLESKALVIATSEHKRGYGLGFYGLNRNGNYTVYHVLFVREIPEERFERIGVGQIFGKEVEEVIRKAGSTEVNLV
ncbi:hypothetical protein PFICI_04557 [Pestalotiopsis fici W106-1]|uniref:Heterokaryon incompatibility domain-containing protein n=1 Tax=Pestalotiopsis fici (strain W106-1 / CGMCC3.15140) TaxID=1229662 RepID=W3XBY6_PESFW|nr:uncharacterized protein PFICI_04557 [Pestalotiopsis fici W106-1]ETS82681.1 hypothetical protein PFICI_04557 [Pestalotiopsis fici W106-1]